MKKLFLITLILIPTLIISTFVLQATNRIAYAAESEHKESTEVVLKEIMQSQNASQISKIDCSKVSDDQFEKLGDAYMELLHPGPQHEAMDQMMGGEGSTSLRLMHIRMGQNYLNCSSSNFNGGMMGSLIAPNGMMGSGNFGMMGGPYMMGNWFGGFYWGSWITQVLIWILLILGIVTLVKWLSRNNK